MYENPMPAIAAIDRPDTVRRFFQRVYGWMFLGLVATALTAFYTVSDYTLLYTIVTNRILFYALIFGELGLVFAISGLVRKMSPALAGFLFLVYSVLNGLTLSVILLVFTEQSVAMTFVVCAIMFGALSVFGLVTRRTLGGLGSFCFMGLIGLIAASLINLIWPNGMLHFLINCVGIIVFAGLTAYDTRKLKEMAVAVDPAGREVQSIAVVGALALYLDFINLFLFLLNFLGDRR